MSNQSLAKSIAKSLDNARVPNMYRKKSLLDYGDAGQAVLDFVKSCDFKKNIVEYGVGLVTCNGSGKATDGDILKVFAKNLVCFANIRTQIIYMDEFEKACDDFDADYFAFLEDHEALIVPTFHSVSFAQYPEGDAKKYKVERKIAQILDSGISLSLHFQCPIDSQTWLSPWLVDKIKDKNKVIII